MVTIARPEELVQASLARWGGYGRNGSGKTTFLTTIPPEERVLVISEEGQNIKPLLGYKHIRVAKIVQWDEVGEVYRLIRHLHENDEKNGEHKCPTVAAFDGWPIRLMINKVTGAHLEPGEEIEWLSRPPDIYPKNWDSWEDAAGLSNYGLLCYMRLPCHLMVWFDEDEPKIDKGVIIRKGGPLLPKQAQPGAKRYLELLGRLFAEIENPGLDDVIPDTASERRRMLFGEHEIYYAKGPVHALGYSMANPTWTKMLPALSAAPLKINGESHEKEEE
mgnify:CR=1 FL=1